MTTQPEALRLAAVPIFERSITWQSQATMELRRLHAQRDALLEALKNYVDGCSLGVNAAEVARAAIKAVEENT
jgi:hypothetical protein